MNPNQLGQSHKPSDSSVRRGVIPFASLLTISLLAIGLTTALARDPDSTSPDVSLQVPQHEHPLKFAALGTADDCDIFAIGGETRTVLARCDGVAQVVREDVTNFGLESPVYLDPEHPLYFSHGRAGHIYLIRRSISVRAADNNPAFVPTTSNFAPLGRAAQCELSTLRPNRTTYWFNLLRAFSDSETLLFARCDDSRSPVNHAPLESKFLGAIDSCRITAIGLNLNAILIKCPPSPAGAPQLQTTPADIGKTFPIEGPGRLTATLADIQSGCRVWEITNPRPIRFLRCPGP